MPKEPRTECREIEYWCADAEMKDRKTDIKYMKKCFPQTRFKLVKNAGHGGLAPFQPERLVKGLRGKDIKASEAKSENSYVLGSDTDCI